MFKSHSKNSVNSTIFYTFEICALVVAVIYLIYAVYAWADNWGFMSGLLAIAQGIVYSLVLFGIGKIIDGHPEKPCGKRPPEEHAHPEDAQPDDQTEDA